MTKVEFVRQYISANPNCKFGECATAFQKEFGTKLRDPVFYTERKKSLSGKRFLYRNGKTELVEVDAKLPPQKPAISSQEVAGVPGSLLNLEAAIDHAYRQVAKVDADLSDVSLLLLKARRLTGKLIVETSVS
jgi:hypothetical protein